MKSPLLWAVIATPGVFAGFTSPLASCATSVSAGEDDADAAPAIDSAIDGIASDGAGDTETPTSGDASPGEDAVADATGSTPDASPPEDASSPTDALATDAADAADAAIDSAIDAEAAIPTVGLVGEWLCSGDTSDTSGAGNDGTGTNITYSPDRNGVIASACSFNGTSSLIGVPSATSLDVTSTWSVSAWVRPAGFSVLAGIVSKYHSNGADGLTVRLSYDSPYTGIDVDEATNNPDAGSGLLTQGAWSHVGVTANGTTVQCYVDGALAYTGTAGYTTAVNTDPLDIGLDYTNRYFNGSIDDVRLYDRVLSASEIQQLYLAP